MSYRSCLLALTGETADAVTHDHIRAVDLPSTGATVFMPLVLVNVGEGLCETRTVRRRVALRSRGVDNG